MSYGILIGSLASQKKFYIGAILAGGRIGDTETASTEKFQWQTETIQALTTSLGSPRSSMVTYTNAGAFGYAVGGVSADNFSSTIEKINYQTDVRSVAGATSQMGRVTSRGYCGSNSGAHGYAAGGFFNGSSITSAEKYNFATETSSNLSSGLSDARSAGFSFINNGSAFYAFCGETVNFFTFSSRVDKWSFSNDTRSSVNSSLAVGADQSGYHFSNSGSAGYAFAAWFAQGGGASVATPAAKWNFATDSQSGVGQSYFFTGYPRSASLHSNAGYALGDGASSVIRKYTFNTETFSSLSQAINPPRGFSAVLSNSIGN